MQINYFYTPKGLAFMARVEYAHRTGDDSRMTRDDHHMLHVMADNGGAPKSEIMERLAEMWAGTPNHIKNQ